MNNGNNKAESLQEVARKDFGSKVKYGNWYWVSDKEGEWVLGMCNIKNEGVLGFRLVNGLSFSFAYKGLGERVDVKLAYVRLTSEWFELLGFSVSGKGDRFTLKDEHDGGAELGLGVGSKVNIHFVNNGETYINFPITYVSDFQNRFWWTLSSDWVDLNGWSFGSVVRSVNDGKIAGDCKVEVVSSLQSGSLDNSGDVIREDIFIEGRALSNDEWVKLESVDSVEIGEVVCGRYRIQDNVVFSSYRVVRVRREVMEG